MSRARKKSAPCCWKCGYRIRSRTGCMRASASTRSVCGIATIQGAMGVKTRSSSRASCNGADMIKGQPVYRGKIVNVFLDGVRLPNGRDAELEVVRHPGG